jgi:shikimate dehydrogenase
MAEQHGHSILNGTEMLVGQGAAAFKLWLGKEADVKVMTSALREALKA